MRIGEIYYVFRKGSDGNPVGLGYVGQTIRTVVARVGQHFECVARGVSHPLYNAMRKHGLDNFTYEVLERVEVSKLDEREVYWIDKLGTYRGGYNQTPGGNNYRFVDEEEFVRLWKDGKSVVEIADETGYSWPTVKRYLSENGVTAVELLQRGRDKSQQSKFRWAPVIQIVPKSRKIVFSFSDLSAAAECMGISHTRLANCCRGEVGVVAGYVWRYSEDVCDEDFASGIYTGEIDMLCENTVGRRRKGCASSKADFGLGLYR